MGIAKGTFYSFFESKEDLCAAIFEQDQAQRIVGWVAQGMTGAELGS